MNNQDEKETKSSDDCGNNVCALSLRSSSGVADASPPPTGSAVNSLTATAVSVVANVNDSVAEATTSTAALLQSPTDTTTATTTTTTQPSRSERRDIKRSTIKHLIERYFFQLQRGCGNPTCDNEFCASSGKVKDMTPNEAAAMALQLFSQDAKLCNASDCPPENALTSSNATTVTTECSSGSGSGQSTIILGSSADSTSSSSTDTSPTATTATTTNSSSTTSSTSSSATATSAEILSINRSAAKSSQTIPHTTTTTTTQQMQASSTNNTSAALEQAAAAQATVSAAPKPPANAEPKREHANLDLLSIDPSAATLAAINYLNEPIAAELIDECVRDENYERLWLVIDHIFSDVDRLSASFPCVYGANDKDGKGAAAGKTEQEQATATEGGAKRADQDADANAESRSKLATAAGLLSSPLGEFNKEALRTLEGETDKDEDSTEPTVLLSSHIDIDDIGASSMGLDMDRTASTSAGANARSQLSRFGIVDVNSAIAEFDAIQQASLQQPRSIFSHLFNDDESLSSAVSNQSDWESDNAPQFYIDLDFGGLRAFKKKLFDLHHPDFYDVLNNSMVSLSGSCMRYKGDNSSEKILYCLVVCFDMMCTPSCSHSAMEFVDRALPPLCKVAAMLPMSIQARLTRIWAVHCKNGLRSLVESFQQLITLQVIADEDNVQESPLVIAATKVLRMVYYASILAGEMDLPTPCAIEDTEGFLDGGAVGGLDDAGTSAGQSGDDDFTFSHVNVQRHENRLETMLGVSAMDSRVPHVPFEEFYNEPLSDAIHMDNDYLAYKNLLMDPENEDHHFSFMCYSFILNPACKVVALYYDSRIRMYSERNSSLYSLLSFNNSDGDVRPDLRLKVRRDKLINDALSGLEMVAMSNPKDLKKQLVVEFVGEQGIDEGGVSKEFFQLIIEEIFNPDIGMFITMEETNTMWFNASALESDSQFTLIGIILGLAIYNNIILAVNFPKVVYRKLMNGRGTFYDLRDFSPTLFRSLDYLLKYDKQDIDDVFMQTFRVNYVTVFGVTMEHDLKPGGGDITVTQENKREFVDLYADFLLNKLVERQFRAFKKGFDMVTDESPLKLLFRPEEIELLVCGSSKFDFKELEKSTEYEGGYTKDAQIIKDFWTVVHAMPMELKRKLLEFTTGSDRVPVGGFSRLKLLITRNGPDSDRLPTSHTCFNVLLLPEYSSKSKLEERLLKAINYSKGFGML